MNDLEAVRRLAAEPTDESVARTWYRIMKSEAQRAPRKRRRLIPAVAAVAVLALIATSVALYRLGTSPPLPAGSSPEAVAALNAMARIAAKGTAVTVAKGQFVLSEVRPFADLCEQAVCRLESSGLALYSDPHTGVGAFVERDRRDAAFVGLRKWVESQPLGLGRPTIDWLASLPSDPHELLTQLPRDAHRRDLWEAVAHLYAGYEIVLTPAQRATLLRALAGMTELSSRDVTVDDVRLVGIRRGEKGSDGLEIMFDPATGRAVGQLNIYSEDPASSEFVRSVPMPGIWRQSITW